WKLDIEGAESDAVRGAERTLKEGPPRIIIAELYDRFYDEFYSVIKQTHPYAYRAFISLDRYDLQLKSPVFAFPEGVQPTSRLYGLAPAPVGRGVNRTLD